MWCGRLINCIQIASCNMSPTLAEAKQALEKAEFTEYAPADDLFFPETGGVIVLPSTISDQHVGELSGFGDDDPELGKAMMRLGAKYYARVADYDDNINEDGTSKIATTSQ